ncbi:hypothetical protein EDB83DRAFT_777532 [Lactarius deliciosus]|nr:hypothetical protein EDB83DRAFT_777532 [Lactarius deliciosus]
MHFVVVNYRVCCTLRHVTAVASVMVTLSSLRRGRGRSCVDVIIAIAVAVSITVGVATVGQDSVGRCVGNGVNAIAAGKQGWFACARGEGTAVAAVVLHWFEMERKGRKKNLSINCLLVKWVRTYTKREWQIESDFKSR